MSGALNPQCIVYPTDKRFGTSATELGFQLKLANLAVESFSFRLNVVGRADLPWPHDLVVIDEKRRRRASLQQLLDLCEFALLYLWGEAIVASLSNSVRLISDHDVNHV